jgi:hypothetical protein
MFHDPVYELMRKDRDWAPAGGTSMNRARQLNDDHTTKFRAALTRLVETEDGLNEITGHNLPWLYWDGDRTGGWWITCLITHLIRVPEDELPTHLSASWVSGDEPMVERPQPVDMTLRGPGARDYDHLAALVVNALRPYKPNTKENER